MPTGPSSSNNSSGRSKPRVSSSPRSRGPSRPAPTQEAPSTTSDSSQESTLDLLRRRQAGSIYESIKSVLEDDSPPPARSERSERPSVRKSEDSESPALPQGETPDEGLEENGEQRNADGPSPAEQAAQRATEARDHLAEQNAASEAFQDMTAEEAEEAHAEDIEDEAAEKAGEEAAEDLLDDELKTDADRNEEEQRKRRRREQEEEEEEEEIKGVEQVAETRSVALGKPVDKRVASTPYSDKELAEAAVPQLPELITGNAVETTLSEGSTGGAENINKILKKDGELDADLKPEVVAEEQAQTIGAGPALDVEEVDDSVSLGVEPEEEVDDVSLAVEPEEEQGEEQEVGEGEPVQEENSQQDEPVEERPVEDSEQREERQEREARLVERVNENAEKAEQTAYEADTQAYQAEVEAYAADSQADSKRLEADLMSSQATGEMEKAQARAEELRKMASTASSPEEAERFRLQAEALFADADVMQAQARVAQAQARVAESRAEVMKAHSELAAARRQASSESLSDAQHLAVEVTSALNFSAEPDRDIGAEISGDTSSEVPSEVAAQGTTLAEEMSGLGGRTGVPGLDNFPEGLPEAGSGMPGGDSVLPGSGSVTSGGASSLPEGLPAEGELPSQAALESGSARAQPTVPGGGREASGSPRERTAAAAQSRRDTRENSPEALVRKFEKSSKPVDKRVESAEDLVSRLSKAEEQAEADVIAAQQATDRARSRAFGVDMDVIAAEGAADRAELALEKAKERKTQVESKKQKSEQVQLAVEKQKEEVEEAEDQAAPTVEPEDESSSESPKRDKSGPGQEGRSQQHSDPQENPYQRSRLEAQAEEQRYRRKEADQRTFELEIEAYAAGAAASRKEMEAYNFAARAKKAKDDAQYKVGELREKAATAPPEEAARLLAEANTIMATARVSTAEATRAQAVANLAEKKARALKIRSQVQQPAPAEAERSDSGSGTPTGGVNFATPFPTGRSVVTPVKRSGPSARKGQGSSSGSVSPPPIQGQTTSSTPSQGKTRPSTPSRGRTLPPAGGRGVSFSSFSGSALSLRSLKGSATSSSAKALRGNIGSKKDSFTASDYLKPNFRSPLDRGAGLLDSGLKNPFISDSKIGPNSLLRDLSGGSSLSPLLDSGPKFDSKSSSSLNDLLKSKSSAFPDFSSDSVSKSSLLSDIKVQDSKLTSELQRVSEDVKKRQPGAGSIAKKEASERVLRRAERGSDEGVRERQERRNSSVARTGTSRVQRAENLVLELDAEIAAAEQEAQVAREAAQEARAVVHRAQLNNVSAVGAAERARKMERYAEQQEQRVKDRRREREQATLRAAEQSRKEQEREAEVESAKRSAQGQKGAPDPSEVSDFFRNKLLASEPEQVRADTISAAPQQAVVQETHSTEGDEAGSLTDAVAPPSIATVTPSLASPAEPPSAVEQARPSGTSSQPIESPSNSAGFSQAGKSKSDVETGKSPRRGGGESSSNYPEAGKSEEPVESLPVVQKKFTEELPVEREPVTEKLSAEKGPIQPEPVVEKQPPAEKRPAIEEKPAVVEAESKPVEFSQAGKSDRELEAGNSSNRGAAGISSNPSVAGKTEGSKEAAPAPRVVSEETVEKSGSRLSKAVVVEKRRVAEKPAAKPPSDRERVADRQSPSPEWPPAKAKPATVGVECTHADFSQTGKSKSEVETGKSPRSGGGESSSNYPVAGKRKEQIEREPVTEKLSAEKGPIQPERVVEKQPPAEKRPAIEEKPAVLEAEKKPVEFSQAGKRKEQIERESVVEKLPTVETKFGENEASPAVGVEENFDKVNPESLRVQSQAAEFLNVGKKEQERFEEPLPLAIEDAKAKRSFDFSRVEELENDTAGPGSSLSTVPERAPSIKLNSEPLQERDGLSSSEAIELPRPRPLNSQETSGTKMSSLISPGNGSEHSVGNGFDENEASASQSAPRSKKSLSSTEGENSEGRAGGESVQTRSHGEEAHPVQTDVAQTSQVVAAEAELLEAKSESSALEAERFAGELEAIEVLGEADRRARERDRARAEEQKKREKRIEASKSGGLEEGSEETVSSPDQKVNAFDQQSEAVWEQPKPDTVPQKAELSGGQDSVEHRESDAISTDERVSREAPAPVKSEGTPGSSPEVFDFAARSEIGAQKRPEAHKQLAVTELGGKSESSVIPEDRGDISTSPANDKTRFPLQDGRSSQPSPFAGVSRQPKPEPISPSVDPSKEGPPGVRKSSSSENLDKKETRKPKAAERKDGVPRREESKEFTAPEVERAAESERVKSREVRSAKSASLHEVEPNEPVAESRKKTAKPRHEATPTARVAEPEEKALEPRRPIPSTEQAARPVRKELAHSRESAPIERVAEAGQNEIRKLRLAERKDGVPEREESKELTAPGVERAAESERVKSREVRSAKSASLHKVEPNEPVAESRKKTPKPRQEVTHTERVAEPKKKAPEPRREADPKKPIAAAQDAREAELAQRADLRRKADLEESPFQPILSPEEVAKLRMSPVSPAEDTNAPPIPKPEAVGPAPSSEEPILSQKDELKEKSSPQVEKDFPFASYMFDDGWDPPAPPRHADELGDSSPRKSTDVQDPPHADKHGDSIRSSLKNVQGPRHSEKLGDSRPKVENSPPLQRSEEGPGLSSVRQQPQRNRHSLGPVRGAHELRAREDDQGYSGPLRRKDDPGANLRDGQTLFERKDGSQRQDSQDLFVPRRRRTDFNESTLFEVKKVSEVGEDEGQVFRKELLAKNELPPPRTVWSKEASAITDEAVSEEKEVVKDTLRDLTSTRMKLGSVDMTEDTSKVYAEVVEDDQADEAQVGYLQQEFRQKTGRELVVEREPAKEKSAPPVEETKPTKPQEKILFEKAKPVSPPEEEEELEKLEEEVKREVKERKKPVVYRRSRAQEALTPPPKPPMEWKSAEPVAEEQDRGVKKLRGRSVRKRPITNRFGSTSSGGGAGKSSNRYKPRKQGEEKEVEQKRTDGEIGVMAGEKLETESGQKLTAVRMEIAEPQDDASHQDGQSGGSSTCSTCGTELPSAQAHYCPVCAQAGQDVMALTKTNYRFAGAKLFAAADTVVASEKAKELIDSRMLTSVASLRFWPKLPGHKDVLMLRQEG